ncbi:MAG: hypothetical protein OES79_02755, partial [Planctomycetota bacterium]|nr:hypothetical protein [Planctomycetota bacterium]
YFLVQNDGRFAVRADDKNTGSIIGRKITSTSWTKHRRPGSFLDSAKRAESSADSSIPPDYRK